MAKLGKIPIALAALLALFMLIGSVNPASFWSGLEGFTQFSPSLTQCGSTLPPDQASAQGYTRIMEWLGLSLVAIMVGLSWAIIGQVFSGAFSGPKYNEFIKGMIWGGVETAALLGLFSAMFVVLFPYGNEKLDTARAYAVLAKNTVMFDFGLMLSANFLAGLATNMSPSFKIPGAAYMTIGFQIAPMFKPIMDILGIAMQLITTAVVLWAGQEFLLCFVKSNMLIILLPAGFFLRGFGVKAGGNALIALAFSMFFLYPQMIIMTGEIVSGQLEDDLVSNNVQPLQHVWNTCIDKPICCLAPAQPASMDASYLPNGNKGATLQDRLNPVEVGHGVFNMRLDPASGSLTAPNFCMYNTVLANVYKATFGVASSLHDAGLLTIPVGVATAVLFKYMNISWLTVAAMIPLSTFAIYAIMEIVFFVFILSILVPIFIIFIMLTFAKEIAKVLGTEIDLSSLEKLI